MLGRLDLKIRPIQKTRAATIGRIEILNFSFARVRFDNRPVHGMFARAEVWTMPEDKGLNQSAPVEPVGEEDWGEDWGDVTAPTPDINRELELYITELVVSRRSDDSSARF
jgi:hypothetical protein